MRTIGTGGHMRPCARPGCVTLVDKGYCPAHTKAKVQGYDKARGTSTQRGYGVRWGRYRDRFLERNPLCGDRPHNLPPTGDSLCQKQGLSVRANVVDHITPVTGPNDPTFYKPEGQQSMCDRCHQIKRQREAMDARGLTTHGGV